MKSYLMALDQGTTSSRCILFDRSGEIRAEVHREFRQFYPQNGWVEQDPIEIWESQLAVARDAMRELNVSAGEIAAIGITNQRETTVVWDRKTGKPIYPAIVWQCRRTAEVCEKLKADGTENMIQDKTGLLVDPYFSATKLQWILQNVAGAAERAKRGELLFGTVDCWLIWNLTGGKVHATDPSNAARTMLFDIHRMSWDKDLLALFGIPEGMLPQVLPSAGKFGETTADLFGAPISIAGVAGDQQAALFGQRCFEPGDIKNTFGTGGFLLMNTGATPVKSTQGLLTTVGWKIGDQTTYVLEGSVFISGAAIQWLRDGLGLIRSASETEAMARSIPDNGGVYFVPAFVGLGAPYWDPYARGSIYGLTRAVKPAHFARAALESMAYQTVDVIEAMRQDASFPIGSVRVDGGASANGFLLQFQADILNLPITRPSCIETTALGAAFLAGIGSGYYKDRKELIQSCGNGRTFEPTMEESVRKSLLAGWHRAVERTILP